MTSSKTLHAARLLCGLALAATGPALAPRLVWAADTTPPATPGETLPTGPGSLSGVWRNAEYKFTGLPARTRALHTVDGQPPPLKPAAAQLLEKRIVEDEKGNEFPSTVSQCLPGGVPEMLFGASYPVQILETPSQVTMLFEEQNHFRTIRLDAAHVKDPDLTYMGDSVGHWDGDTLVVDTIGLNDTTTLDMVGTPHTTALHVVERYRRIKPNMIEIRVTVDDPGTFTKPWDTKVTYKAAPPGTHINEYICENQRNAPDKSGFSGFDTSH